VWFPPDRKVDIEVGATYGENPRSNGARTMKKATKKTTKKTRCTCPSATHGHRPGKCVSMATESDGMCKFCHTKAAADAAIDRGKTIDPLNQPRSARGAF